MKTSKITLRTLKSFINKNRGDLYINCKSHFDGMVDCVMPIENAEFTKATATERNLDHTIGISGAWFVLGGSDFYTYYSDGVYTGYEVSNCTGHFIIATMNDPRAEPQIPEDEPQREKEIRMLHELHDLRGYFAEEYNSEDVEIMAQNIRNDYPIFMGTTTDIADDKIINDLKTSENAYNALKQQYDELLTNYRNMTDAFAELVSKRDEMLKFILDEETSPYKMEYLFWPMDEIVRAKLKNHIPLLDEEINFVIENIKS